MPCLGPPNLVPPLENAYYTTDNIAWIQLDLNMPHFLTPPICGFKRDRKELNLFKNRQNHLQPGEKVHLDGPVDVRGIHFCEDVLVLAVNDARLFQFLGDSELLAAPLRLEVVGGHIADHLCEWSAR